MRNLFSIPTKQTEPEAGNQPPVPPEEKDTPEKKIKACRTKKRSFRPTGKIRATPRRVFTLAFRKGRGLSLRKPWGRR